VETEARKVKVGKTKRRRGEDIKREKTKNQKRREQ